MEKTKIPIVIATKNRGKTEEIRDYLRQYPVDIKNLDDYKGEVLISLAAFYGDTRLIDNILFSK